MTTIAIDTTVALSTTQVNDLLLNNVSCVFRYVAPQAWKRITPDEYKRIVATKMQVTLNWESNGNDFSNPNINWTSYTQQAVQQAQACGYPAGSVIYFSCDEDIQSPSRNTFNNAVRTIQAHIGPYQVGLYGPWDALIWAQELGVKFFWQCMSTNYSNHRNANCWPGTHVWQRHNATIAGVSCDTNDIKIANFGQANANFSPITKASVVEMFLAKDSTGQHYLCDGFRSTKISANRASLMAQLSGDQFGSCFTLGRSADGKDNAEWSHTPNGVTGIVRTGWVADFGPVVEDNGGVNPATLSAADIDKIAAEVAAKITPGASVEDVDTTIKAALNSTTLKITTA